MKGNKHPWFAVLKMHKIKMQEDQYLLCSLTRACKLKNDRLHACLPIQRGLLSVILSTTERHFFAINQPFLSTLYRALFSTTYFGLFRASEVMASAHTVLAKDVHIGQNKHKVLFILRSSKTHQRHMHPQMIKISSQELSQKFKTSGLPCPYHLLRQYTTMRGGYKSEVEPFFTFRDGSAVTARQLNLCLKTILNIANFDESYYSVHSLRAGRSCDLYRLGMSIESIKKLER